MNSLELKKYSYLQGIIPPEHESKKLYQYCSCSDCQSYSMVEMKLAGRDHRFSKMEETQVNMFSDLSELVTGYEENILKLLNLPSIDEVRADQSGEEIAPKWSNEKFKINRKQVAGLNRIFSEWQFELIGDRKVEAVKELIVPVRNKIIQVNKKSFSAIGLGSPIWTFWVYASYSVGTEEANRLVKRELRKLGRSEEEINRIITQLAPQASNLALQKMITDGTKRIKNRKASDLKIIKSALVDMMENGKSPIVAARKINKQIGEKSLWRELRIARSDPILAMNAAFKEQFKSAGVNYVQWKALGGSKTCAICHSLNQAIWRANQSHPSPVESTHPNCYCILQPLYITTSPIQSNWQNRDPYSNPYSQNEIDNFRDTFNRI